MNKKQLDDIKRKTEHSYNDIVKMTDMEFWKTVTQSMVKGRITPQQHEYLNKQRQIHDITPQEQDLLEVFGGKLLR